jgi:hypothetical protein
MGCLPNTVCLFSNKPWKRENPTPLFRRLSSLWRPGKERESRAHGWETVTIPRSWSHTTACTGWARVKGCEEPRLAVGPDSRKKSSQLWRALWRPDKFHSEKGLEGLRQKGNKEQDYDIWFKWNNKYVCESKLKLIISKQVEWHPCYILWSSWIWSLPLLCSYSSLDMSSLNTLPG